MKKRNNNVWLQCCLGALVVLPVAASANLNLIQDGDFSSPILANPPLATTYYYNPGGSPYYIAGQAGLNEGPTVQNMPWTFNFSQYNYGSGIAYVPSAWDGSANSQVAFLQQDGALISQTFTAPVGGTYSLSFQDGGRANVGGNTTFEVLLNNSIVKTFNTITGQPMTDQNFNISLNSGANTLEFLVTAQRNGSDNTAFINNVNVSAVPEPTTMVAGALLLLPFGMSTLRMLRKSRTA
jgi:hypothetical protein